VLELAKLVARLGYHVDVVTRRFENQPEFDIINKNPRVWRIPFGGKGFIRKEEMHEHIGDLVTNFLAEVHEKKSSRKSGEALIIPVIDYPADHPT
jgi:mannosylfructose-phosphate synthase